MLPMLLIPVIFLVSNTSVSYPFQCFSGPGCYNIMLYFSYFLTISMPHLYFILNISCKSVHEHQTPNTQVTNCNHFFSRYFGSCFFFSFCSFFYLFFFLFHLIFMCFGVEMAHLMHHRTTMSVWVDEKRRMCIVYMMPLLMLFCLTVHSHRYKSTMDTV